MRFKLLLISFFVFNLLCAQSTESSKNPERALQDYFELPRESIYLHLNKSDYANGENLWFKGYVYDRFEKLPLKETSNLYVGVYHKDGTQKEKKLFLTKDGFVQGHFAIDSTFTPGEFYIKAGTNWMKNFKEDDSFIQKFQVVNPSESKKIQTVNGKENDMQFLPEGGYLVNDIMNTIGVKVLNSNGYGIPLKDVVVVDGHGTEVTKFSTGNFGHGKFEFMPQLGSKYSAVVTYDDSSSKIYDLPSARMEGITISLRNNSRQERIAVIVSTNNYTKNKSPNASYYALIHKNGGSERIPFQFKEGETQSGFFLSKENLSTGVNVITIFNEKNQPLVERLFFNSYNLTYPQVNTTLKKFTTDSLEVKLSFRGQNRSKVNLSASILPSDTDAYNHSDNIYSTFYLKPYVKGFIERGAYYFRDITPKKEYELDLLLLNQGWSRYDWKSVFGDAPEQQFEFERGLTLDVKLNEANEDGKTFYIFPTMNHLEQEVAVRAGDKQFSVANFFLAKEEQVFLAEKNSKGRLIKPKLYIASKNKNREDKITPWLSNRSSLKTLEKPYQVNLMKEDNTISLDEVVVRQKKLLNKARENPNVQGFLKRKIKPVDEKTVSNFPFVLDLIRASGYQVIEDPASATVFVTSRRGGTLDLYINGVREPNLDRLRVLPTEEIESYFFDRNKAIPGVTNGFTESLYIYYRRGGDFLNNGVGGQPAISTGYKIEQGFEVTKNFYAPLYTTYYNDLFERFGVVHWEPEIRIDANGGSFKILNTGLEALKICIEGMDGFGNLYSEIKTIEVDKP